MKCFLTSACYFIHLSSVSSKMAEVSACLRVFPKEIVNVFMVVLEGVVKQETAEIILFLVVWMRACGRSGRFEQESLSKGFLQVLPAWPSW